jgi:peptide/nickel transport system substrate-binding protein
MKRWFLPLLILAVAAVVMAGCSTASSSTTSPAATVTTSSPPATSQPASSTPPSSSPVPSSTTPAPSSSQYGGILKEAIASGPAGPFGTPWLNSLSPISSQMLSLEPLLREQVDGSLTPCLATSYDIVNDPTNPSITFHLRKGVKFTDGTDFNAQAVEWNLQQWQASGMASGTTQFWKSIDVIDDYTIRINLTAWQNPMLRSFGDATAFQVSPTAYQKNGDAYMQTHMVGTGPFVQTNFQRDVSMTFTRNTNYWDTGKPYLDGIVQLFVADDLTRESLFKSGGADMMDCNNNDLLASELQQAGYTILPQPHSGFFSLVPDSINADSPWSNINVRLAAEYAIDKQALAKTFGYGFEQAADQYYPPGTSAYDANLAPRAYDPSKAKQLLADAGYPTGFKTNLVVAVNASRDMAVAMQAELAAVGIQASLQYPQFGAWIQQVTGTWNNGVQFMTQSLWPNPNANWNLFTSEPAPNWFKSLKHPDGWKDMLFGSFATTTPDPATMQKLEDALYNDETFIPITWHEGTFAASSKVHDTGYGTRGMWTWWNSQNTWLSK